MIHYVVNFQVHEININSLVDKRELNMFSSTLNLILVSAGKTFSD